MQPAARGLFGTPTRGGRRWSFFAPFRAPMSARTLWLVTTRKILGVGGAVLAAQGLMSRSRIHAAIASGELPSSRPARRRIIRVEDFAVFLGVRVADLALEPLSSAESAALAISRSSLGSAR